MEISQSPLHLDYRPTKKEVEVFITIKHSSDLEHDYYKHFNYIDNS